MKEFMFDELPVEQRKQVLEDNCEKVESKTYIDRWTPTQVQQEKNNYIDLQSKIAKLTAELAQVQAEYKGEIKPLKESAGIILGNIQQGGELVTKDCYKFVDEDEKMVGYYDAKGHLIDSRPATPEEAGGNLFSAVKRMHIGQIEQPKQAAVS